MTKETLKTALRLEREKYELLKSEYEENIKLTTEYANLNARLKEEIRVYEYYFEHREKVVHCKDCKFNGLFTCPLSYIEKQTLCFINQSPDFYCAVGKLKEVKK